MNDLARNNIRLRYIKGDLNIPGDVPSRDPRFQKIIDDYDKEEEEKRKCGIAEFDSIIAPVTTKIVFEGLDAFLQQVTEGYKTDLGIEDKLPWVMIE